MPKYGAFRLCEDTKTYKLFETPLPPNDRRRKDRIMDLTSLIINEEVQSV